MRYVKRKMLVCGVIMFLVLATSAIPCNVALTCGGGKTAWCHTTSSCTETSHCGYTETGVTCSCGDNTVSFDCPVV